MAWQKGDMDQSLRGIVSELVAEVFRTNPDNDDRAASLLKQKLESSNIGSPWHVVIGKNYATYFTHEKGTFAYFQEGNFAITVFRAGL